MMPASVYKMLRIIRDNPGANRAQLAEIYGAKMESASIGNSMAHIRNAGWAVIDRHSVGRHYRVNLTEKGETALLLVEMLEALE